LTVSQSSKIIQDYSIAIPTPISWHARRADEKSESKRWERWTIFLGRKLHFLSVTRRDVPGKEESDSRNVHFSGLLSFASRSPLRLIIPKVMPPIITGSPRADGRPRRAIQSLFICFSPDSFRSPKALLHTSTVKSPFHRSE